MLSKKQGMFTIGLGAVLLGTGIRLGMTAGRPKKAVEEKVEVVEVKDLAGPEIDATKSKKDIGKSDIKLDTSELKDVSPINIEV